MRPTTLEELCDWYACACNMHGRAVIDDLLVGMYRPELERIAQRHHTTLLAMRLEGTPQDYRVAELASCIEIWLCNTHRGRSIDWGGYTAAINALLEELQHDR